MAKSKDSNTRQLEIFNQKRVEQEQMAKECKVKFTAFDFEPFEPKTPAQAKFVKAYTTQTATGDDYHILNAGTAGTGKTFLAMQMALREVIIEKKKEKVVIVRSPVPSRDQGALPGDQKDKDEPYTIPYVALCDEIFKYKSNNFENLVKKQIIDFRTNGNLRGMTFNDCVIIVDECQNFNYSELETILTRVGYNCRIILCGDSVQSDLNRSKYDVSGFDQMYKILQKIKSCKIIDFQIEDIVRSGFVKDFLIAKYEYETGIKYVPRDSTERESEYEKPALLSATA